MFDVVFKVRNELLRVSREPPTLEVISNVIKMFSGIDEITFIKFEAHPSNPILGQFNKWSRMPSVYAPFTIFVEIRYAGHLSQKWKKFVVCKELCHALDSEDDHHSTSASSINQLVNDFSLMSARKKNIDINGVLGSELSAFFAAIELVFPMQMRESILQKACGDLGQLDVAGISDRLMIPKSVVTAAFDPDYMRVIKSLST